MSSFCFIQGDILLIDVKQFFGTSCTAAFSISFPNNKNLILANVETNKISEFHDFFEKNPDITIEECKYELPNIKEKKIYVCSFALNGFKLHELINSIFTGGWEICNTVDSLCSKVCAANITDLKHLAYVLKKIDCPFSPTLEEFPTIRVDNFPNNFDESYFQVFNSKFLHVATPKTKFFIPEQLNILSSYIALQNLEDANKVKGLLDKATMSNNILSSSFLSDDLFTVPEIIIPTMNAQHIQNSNQMQTGEQSPQSNQTLINNQPYFQQHSPQNPNIMPVHNQPIFPQFMSPPIQNIQNLNQIPPQNMQNFQQNPNQIPIQPQPNPPLLQQNPNQIPIQQQPNPPPLQQNPNQIPIQQQPNPPPLQQNPNQIPIQQQPNPPPLQQNPNQIPIQQQPNPPPLQQKPNQNALWTQIPQQVSSEQTSTNQQTPNKNEVFICPSSFLRTVIVTQPKHINKEDLEKDLSKYGILDRVDLIESSNTNNTFRAVYKKEGSLNTLLNSKQFKYCAVKMNIKISPIPSSPVIQYYPENQITNFSSLCDNVFNTVIIAFENGSKMEDIIKQIDRFGVYKQILYQCYEDRIEVAVTFDQVGSAQTLLNCNEYKSSAKMAKDLKPFRQNQPSFIPNQFGHQLHQTQNARKTYLSQSDQISISLNNDS